MTSPHFAIIARCALVLALIVVVLGAYVRLSHAGLGCPDWPGCYGEMVVPVDAEGAAALYPERPLETHKAWKEMIHRYAAGLLGLLILALALVAWRQRTRPGQPVVIPLVLLLLVIIQALLGMWTVTLLLKPVVVMGHLLGGLLILSLLFWLTLKTFRLSSGQGSDALIPWVIFGLCVLVIQIALGGWTSANYAALACPDLPVCQGEWWPAMDFREAFTFWRGIGIDYEGGVLAGDARTAIHMSHRIGAVITTVVWLIIIIRALMIDSRMVRFTAGIVVCLLVAQVSLGISNIITALPLLVAVAHNAVAALLLLSVIALLYSSLLPEHKCGGVIG